MQQTERDIVQKNFDTMANALVAYRKRVSNRLQDLEEVLQEVETGIGLVHGIVAEMKQANGIVKSPPVLHAVEDKKGN